MLTKTLPQRKKKMRFFAFGRQKFQGIVIITLLLLLIYVIDSYNVNTEGH